MENELNPKFYPVEESDILVMSFLMQNGDVAECMASGFKTPYEALVRSVERSNRSWAVYSEDGLLLALFGLVGAESKWAMPWMTITTVMSDCYPLTLLRTTREIVSGWAEDWALYNWVHVDNARSKALLEVLGFTLEEPAPMPGGVPSEMFHLFWMGEKPCVS